MPGPDYSLPLLNTGPPTFKSALQPLTIFAGTIVTYDLPQISDPDGDHWTISIDIGSAVFAKINGNTFSFAPKKEN